MGKKVAIGKNYVVKKGDLMNPERKKRKKLGAKIGTGYESDMAVTLTQRPSDYHWSLYISSKWYFFSIITSK